MCIDEQLLSSYLDGELKEPFRSQTEEHLAYCPACRARLERLMDLDALIWKATPSDEELGIHKDDVLSSIEERLFKDGAKVSVLHRRISLSVSNLLTCAAAVVVVFIGGFILFGSNSRQTSEILPSYSMQADRENVRFVSNDQRSGLDSYSLEEILDYLDDKGYDVDLSIKGLSPIESME